MVAVGRSDCESSYRTIGLAGGRFMGPVRSIGLHGPLPHPPAALSQNDETKPIAGPEAR